jgi:uncharacterized membrane protein YeaQ/YmgE (transglycosylase-associated protein family)
MDAWSTIAIGSAVGFLWKRLATTNRASGFSNILLGITGAFAASWLFDVFLQSGLSFDTYSIVVVICGAALVLWSYSRIAHQHTEPAVAGPQSESVHRSQVGGSKSGSRDKPARAA